ncbi:MAG TPA: fasciclin domain-containing protein [Pyrinomonadaceae bacterium]
MKRMIIGTMLVIAFAVPAVAQDFRPIPNPPKTNTVVELLRAAGNFKTFLSLLEKAGMQDNSFRSGLITLGIIPTDQRGNSTQAGPGGGPSYHTLLAPTDAAFAKLPSGALEGLKKNPARLRDFLLAHLIPGKVMIADVLTPIGDGTSKTYKELKSRQGQVLGFQCNGHTGMHLPRINGRARVGQFQDVLASDFLLVIHEIDAVLM